MRSHNLRPLTISLASAEFLLIASAASSFAASPLKMNFITHGVFFSAESKQPKVLDPQVFVRDAAIPAATGPQGIKRVGFRLTVKECVTGHFGVAN